MSLFDPGRELIAVRACELRSGDRVMRRRRLGPVVQSIRKQGYWTYVSYCGAVGGEHLRANTPMVVERLVVAAA